jgi:cytochrome P450
MCFTWYNLTDHFSKASVRLCSSSKIWLIDQLYIKLGFRLWPNGTEVSRYIENDITLSSYTIPSGTHVDLNPSVHFRSPDHFPEPDKNIPERWLRKDEASEFKDLDLDLDKINKLIDAAEKVRICKIYL